MNDTVVVIEQGDTTVVEVQTPGPQGVPGAAGGVTSVNTRTGAVTLSKTDVGLGNVDNTSDANKPVSTAQATALAGKEPTIAAGTTAQYWRGDKAWVTLDKTVVGLGNVDNTADVSKPISTLVQAALDAKLGLGGGTLTGALNAPSLSLTSATGDTLTLNAASGQNAAARFRLNNTERGLIYALSGSTDFFFRSQNRIALLANNATTVQYYYFDTALYTTTASVTLGSSANYWSQAYLSRAYLNSTAYLDGATAGMIGINTTATHTLTLPSASSGVALYNTADQTTNYERVRMAWSSNTFVIQTEKGGTGSNRNLTLTAAGDMRIQAPGANVFIANDSSTAVRVGVGGTYSFTGNIYSYEGSFTASAGVQQVFRLIPTISQSGTAGYSALVINATESTVGTGAKLLADLQVGGVSKFRVTNTGIVDYVGTSNATPGDGDTWYDSTIGAMAYYVGGFNSIPEGVIYFAKSIVSTGNTTTATSLLSATFRGTKTLPPNFLAAKGVRIKLKGVYTTTVATSGVTVPVTLGGTTIASVNLTALGNAATNRAWSGEVLIRAETTGTSGTVVCAGGAQFTTGMTGQVFGDLSNNGATTTINTTVAQVLDVTAAFNSSVATQDIKVLSAVIEVVA